MLSKKNDIITHTMIILYLRDLLHNDSSIFIIEITPLPLFNF